MSLTQQQQQVVDYLKGAPSDTTVKINAIAGSGKTHTLVAISKALNPTNGLYLAYNKSIATEAAQKFPRSVECKTTHSLAYGNTVRPLKLKVGFFSYKSITEKISYDSKLELIELIREFCLSEYVDFHDFSAELQLTPFMESLCLKYLDLMGSGKIECTHDFYLKLFHILLATNEIEMEPLDLLTVDECVVGRTGIKTNEGVKSIVNLYNMQQKGLPLPKAKSFNKDTKQFEYKEIAKVHNNGKKETFKVTTTSKVSLKATAGHKVLTQHGYKEVKDLVPYKDYILSDTLDNLRAAKLLNSDQYQIILGGYLGDGSLIQEKPNVNCYSMRFTQGEAQLDYLSWKLTAFESLATKLTHSGYTGKLSIHQTTQVPNFILDSDPFTEILNSVTPLGLAIWAMDDGTLQTKRFTLCSNAFTKEQNDQLSAMLQSKFNLTAKTVSNGKGHYQLSFSTKETTMFLDLIKPYLHPIFLAKWELGTNSNLYQLDNKFLSYGASYVESVTINKEMNVYDLSVVDNNNYVTTSTAGSDHSVGLLVHNCGDLNMVTLEITKLLPAKVKIFVGDERQNIYGFNHTVNVFEHLKEGTSFSLTQSFRVDESIAKRIQTFGKRYLSPSFEFKGIKHIDKTIHDRCVIARTNASLIDYMIELNANSTPYSLVRSAADIFKLPLIVCSFAYQGKIYAPEYKHLQSDIDEWYENPSLHSDHKTVFSYLSTSHSHDMPLVNAIKLVGKHGKSTVIEASKIAKSHEKVSCNLTLASAHSVKG